MPQESVAVPGVDRPNFTPIDVVKAVVLVVAVCTLALWGFGSWEFPWNIVVGLAAPIIVILVWALFLSPRAVLHLHPYLRAAVELLIYVGVTLAWWSMQQPILGIAFAVVAVAAGVISGRRSIS